MNAQETLANAADPDWKWLYRVGGLSAVVLAVAYIVIIVLYVFAGVPPKGAEAHLSYLAKNTTAWWWILSLSVLTDFLFVPVALSLYFALKEIHRSAMLLASACVGLFVVLDLALTWTSYAALITLSGNYAGAASETQRAALVAAANYPSALLESKLLGVYIILVPGLGFLITGFVMLKSIFSKSTAYLAVASGGLGIVSVVGPSFLGMTIIIASALTTVWLFLVGYRLYRLGRE
jgi:hypothetical protein